ncbi:MAG: DnaJ domain-containing protein [Anaerolineales bacterium]|nr:DnaJ domain-containing protein [Anaerolineales bacterium]
MAIGNLYSLLGISPNASAEDIKIAYRGAARRFHPDVNKSAAAAEEFRLISEAHAILSDPAQRARYDAQSKEQGGSALTLRCALSCSRVPVLNEPQVLYTLVEIRPALSLDNLPPPPINLAMVIDRSTSMQGERLNRVKEAVMQLIDSLRPNDTCSIIAFSDKAEVIFSAQTGSPEQKQLAKAKVSTINAYGGTEILGGLMAGLLELYPHLSPSAVNHLMLLTDGRTYGDEGDCLLLAALAAADGISLSGLGIGEEWNDKFLDELTGLTGGSTEYIRSPEQVYQFLQNKVRSLEAAFGERLTLRVLLDQNVQLLEAFKISPEPGPLETEETVRLGSLLRDRPLVVLLKFKLPPLPEGARPIARLALYGDVPGLGRKDERVTYDVAVTAVANLKPPPPPQVIIEALSKYSHHKLQERAWQQAEAGNLAGASRLLSMLGTRLLASGQPELAKVAIVEAKRLEQQQAVSEESKKRIKYGTRALLLPQVQDLNLDSTQP